MSQEQNATRKLRCRNFGLFGCSKLNREVSDEDCNKCQNFESRYIEYPITVENIDVVSFQYNAGLRNQDVGKPVRIRPCDEEYEGKTFLGIFLGELPLYNSVCLNKSNVLTVRPVGNPAIFVPELNKIIFGAESWWQIVKNPAEVGEISDETIQNQWYVQMLRDMSRKQDKIRDK